MAKKNVPNKKNPFSNLTNAAIADIIFGEVRNNGKAIKATANAVKEGDKAIIETTIAGVKKICENQDVTNKNLATHDSNSAKQHEKTRGEIKDLKGTIEKFSKRFGLSKAFKLLVVVAVLLAVLIALPCAIAAKYSPLEVFGVVLCAAGATMGILFLIRELIVG